GQKQRLISLLQKKYGDWAKLMVDFESDSATSWKELSQKGNLYLRPGGEGIHVMREFLSLLASRYYQLMHDTIRRYDQRALILGDRYQSFYYPEVIRATRNNLDVISTNLNPRWSDGTFPSFQMDTLYELAGAPALVTEIYMSAVENRSGNRNTHGPFPIVPTQAERA